MKGRKPTPSVLKMVRGNPGKRPINLDEPTYAILDVACPPELTEDDARAEWDRAIVPAIVSRQITVADRPLAIAHCELWSTWRSQVLDASKHAHVVASKQGNPMANPARRMANQSLMLLCKVDAELGLTPTSRTRVHVPKAAEPQLSKWAGILK